MSEEMELILETEDLVLLVALLLCTSVRKTEQLKFATEHRKLCFPMIKPLEIWGLREGSED